MSSTLIIGDTHIPFEHPSYLSFCKRIHKAFKCTRVVHIGDLVDNHAISYHEHDPNGMSPADEMNEVDKRLKQWFKAFPNVYLSWGNHDSLVDRKGRTAGLPERCFRQFRDIWQLPHGWRDDFNWVFDGVLYTHGTSCGKTAHVQHAVDNRMPTVIGHAHSTAGVEWMASERDCIFGMAVGCGIDRHSYAMAYGKPFRRKPILSCGVVTKTSRGYDARVLTMDME